MDPNEQVDGLFDTIANEEPGAAVPEKQKEGEEPKPLDPNIQTAEEDVIGDDSQDYSRKEQPKQSEEAENTEPLKEEIKTETDTQTETETETKTETEVDWKQNLPPAPQPYNGPAPQIDPETGNITNMSPEQYEEYILQKAEARAAERAYSSLVENKALEAAEAILPELKTNVAVRRLVENARVASIINGEQIDSYEAAKLVKEALGISPEKIDEARAQGAQNAKVSITTSKAAAVETGASAPKASPTKIDKLDKRLKSGDDEAFAELLDIWSEEGKI
jgi:hypothetical protein